MGMFDWFRYGCPHCGTVISTQSKAGECSLCDYDIGNVPPNVAGDLHNETNYCESCKKPSTIIVQTMVTIVGRPPYAGLDK